ncbi:MAG: DNA-3-methyladenine glycosylase I [Pseudomonadales bacterium]|nr:DNA-3-methyladenine glycosylase I [Pseudomonadales bacterium]
MVKTDPRRCPWCRDDPLYVSYHDEEWGVPVADERALFERLVLEGMQAGLSWLTVLRKRAHMQKVFFNFEPAKLSSAGTPALERWMNDAGVIRHRGKLEAMIGNARATLALDGGLAHLLWSFVDGRPIQNRYKRMADVPSETSESRAMAGALKKAGFRFVGPTTCYALMQSAGMVNDHLVDCAAHKRCSVEAKSWLL